MKDCIHEYELISGPFQHPQVRCKKCGCKYDLKYRFRLKPALISIPIFALATLLISTVLREYSLPAMLIYGCAGFISVALTNWLARRIYAPKLITDPETYGDKMSSK